LRFYDTSGPAAGHLRKLTISLRELSRLKVNLSTDVGNSEASGHASAQLRNLFGGAEALSLDVSTGTRTRKSYSGRLVKPLPGLLPRTGARAELYANTVTANMPWAACDEVSRSVGADVAWGGVVPTAVTADGGMVFGARHRLSAGGVWRQITGLDRDAAMAVRREAGDSVKHAVRYSYHRDGRDEPRIPTAGSMVKAALEVAGVGPLGGDVGFAKGEVEFGGAIPLSSFDPSHPKRASLTAGLRAGLLCPLPVGLSTRFRPSRLSDRFVLGGPTDVRGFDVGGIGPHSGRNGLGGDLLAAANVNLLVPLPKTAPDSGFRVQAFLNSGRLVGLRAGGGLAGQPDANGTLGVAQVGRALAGAARELVDGLPSVAAGVGVVYGSSQARFELNFALPLVARRGERPTKGFAVGFGLEFL
jgi:outer membrane protein insertion porin family